MLNLLKSAIFCLGLMGANAHACSFVDLQFEDLFEQAEHVFSGRLVQGKNDVIAVDTVWKGTPFSEATIKLPQFPTSCDLQLSAGETYLFFENGQPPFQIMMDTGTTGFDYLPAQWLSELQALKTQ